MFEELGESGRILDLGVGTGRIALPIQRHGLEVVGVDLSNGMLARAKKKGVENPLRANALQLPFSDKAFETSLLVHFLHLIRDWKRLIQEVTRVTKHTVISLDFKRPPGTVSLRQSYLNRAATRGVHPTIRLESETALAELVTPTRMRLIDSTTVRRERTMNELENRLLAVTWGVPENVHLEVMHELREEAPKKNWDYLRETYLLVWNVDDLAKSIPRL